MQSQCPAGYKLLWRESQISLASEAALFIQRRQTVPCIHGQVSINVGGSHKQIGGDQFTVQQLIRYDVIVINDADVCFARQAGVIQTAVKCTQLESVFRALC